MSDDVLEQVKALLALIDEAQRGQTEVVNEFEVYDTAEDVLPRLVEELRTERQKVKQLTEAIGDPEERLREVLRTQGQWLGDWDEWTGLGAQKGYNSLTVTARTALAHLHGHHDDTNVPYMHCVLCAAFRVPWRSAPAPVAPETER